MEEVDGGFVGGWGLLIWPTCGHFCLLFSIDLYQDCAPLRLCIG